MRPVWSPSSSSSASASASGPATSPSAIAATTSASFPRRSSSCTIASTACASAEATSAASPPTRTGVSAMLLAEDRVQLVLEAAALDRAVDPALLRRVRLPPPAAGAARLAGLDRPRARGAADRGEAAVVQRVVGHVAFAHVVPDVLLVPFGQRIELDDRAVVVVDLDLADVRAARPLVAAQPRDPCVQRVQMLGQRPDLAEVAAEQAEVDARLEEVDAVLSDHVLDLVPIRLDELELEARVAVAQTVREFERLGGKAAGVDAEHWHGRVELVRHVDQDDAVDLERGGDREARHELRDRPFEHRLRLLAFELDRQLACFQLVQKLDAAHAST